MNSSKWSAIFCAAATLYCFAVVTFSSAVLIFAVNLLWTRYEFIHPSFQTKGLKNCLPQSSLSEYIFNAYPFSINLYIDFVSSKVSVAKHDSKTNTWCSEFVSEMDFKSTRT